MSSSIKRIGVITSGGDCGGLNAVIKGVARYAYSLGIESVVIPNGYAGLYNLVDPFLRKLMLVHHHLNELLRLQRPGLYLHLLDWRMHEQIEHLFCWRTRPLHLP